MNRTPLLLVFLASAWLCPAQTPRGTFTLTSPEFLKGGAYPAEFTRDGERAPPPLAWSDAPVGTRSFAVTMHHIPGPGDKHVYLVIYNIPVSVKSLAKNVRDIGVWGVNTVNSQPEYTPRCSQAPGPKTYTLIVYALSAEPKLAFPATRVTMDMLLEAIKDKTLAASAIDVIYARQGESYLHLSGDQEQKVQVMIQQFGEKQKQLREDLLKQLKETLDPGQ
jgi:phosphatidylethanolamine-binding protein (PEBP) family uncharacterized protein